MSQEYSNDDILEMLRRCRDEEGVCTTTVFDDRSDTCSSSLVSQRFGGWYDALDAAGIDPADRGRTQIYSDEDILEMLRECNDTHDACTATNFDKMDDMCSSTLVMRRFGSWKEAKEEAGIDDDLSSRTGRKQKYTDEEILSHLRECARRNDGNCTVELLSNEGDLTSPSVAAERFGSWLDAKEAAGLESARSSNARPQKFSDEDYYEFLRECKERYGKATQRIFNKDDDFPSASAIRKRFGKWSDAKEQAGIGDDTTRYTDDDLLEALRDCAETYGSCSASRFASDDSYPSPETVQRRFGSWSDAKREAGVE